HVSGPPTTPATLQRAWPCLVRISSLVIPTRDLVSDHVRTHRWPGIPVAASTQVGGREDVVDLGEVEEMQQGRASQLAGMASCRGVVRAQSVLKRIHGE